MSVGGSRSSIGAAGPCGPNLDGRRYIDVPFADDDEAKFPCDHSQATPSPSLSKPDRYPGEPSYSGAAPAARAWAQFL